MLPDQNLTLALFCILVYLTVPLLSLDVWTARAPACVCAKVMIPILLKLRGSACVCVCVCVKKGRKSNIKEGDPYGSRACECVCQGLHSIILQLQR